MLTLIASNTFGATVPKELKASPETTAAIGDVILYPAPSSLPASDQYEVRVLIGNEWKESYVYFDRARTAGNGSNDIIGRTFSWTTLETTDPVKIRVTRKEGPFENVTIRPLRYEITPKKVDEKTVEFTVKPGQKVSVEFDTELRENCFTGPPYGLTCITDAMMLFADRKREHSAIAGIPEADVFNVEPGDHQVLTPVEGLSGVSAGKSTLGNASGRKVVVFKPGVHDLGYWQVPNNIEHLHFEPGSVVYGAIDVIPQGREAWSMDYESIYKGGWSQETLRSTFKITGPGVLSGAKLPWHLKKDFSYSKNDDWWEHVKLVQLAAENITVEDLVMANSPYWVLSFINDADPRSHGTFDNFKMVGAWTYNNDGLPVGSNSTVSNAFIHANDDALKLYHNGAHVENCVVWQATNGAVFQFGWFPKSVSDVEVKQVDIIHFENWYGVNQSNRAVFNYADSGGKGLIDNIRFSSVTIEGPVLRLFGFKSSNGQQFRNFAFNDLKTDGIGVGQLGPPGRNYFIGDMRDFRFSDFTSRNQTITEPEQAQFDFAEGAGSAFTFSDTSSR